MYERGDSISDIAKAVNHGEKGIYNKVCLMGYERKVFDKHDVRMAAIYKDKDWCFDRYINQQKTFDEMATEAHCSKRVIQKWCADVYGYNMHTYRHYAKLKPTEREIVMAGRLGDGHITKGDQPLYIEAHAENQKDYLFWKFSKTIAFLQQICGMSGGDADSVRRAIGHKNEAAIAAALPLILEGYCSHASSSRSQAEQEAKAFLQIIQDSSSYQLGLNHATGYSILTYYCAYYRYYYPVEFVIALLNTADNQKKILAGTALAAQRGIKIMPIRFRHSLDQYTPDVANRAIYKGMASIKYLNKRIGRELYALRDNTYADFISLLQDIKHKTSVNSRQLQILIELDFFHEFGNPNQLKAQVELFDKYSDSIQLSKATVDPFIDHDAMLTLCEKETEKKYINVDWLGIVRHCAKETSEIITPVSDILQYEMDNLGYLQYQNPSLASTYHYILSIDGKYKNKTIALYQLATGQTVNFKIRPSTMDQNPIAKGDIIKVLGTKQEGKWSRTDAGWVQSITDFNTFLYKYSHVR